MTPVTPDQVKAAVLASGKQWLPTRSCSICDSSIGYLVDGEDLFFSSACNCVVYGSPPEPRDWSDPADWINQQDNEQARREVAALFTLTL